MRSSVIKKRRRLSRKSKKPSLALKHSLRSKIKKIKKIKPAKTF